MVRKNSLPMIGVFVQPGEDELIYALSKEYNLPKTTICRALIRAGLAVFNQAPQEIIALAGVKA